MVIHDRGTIVIRQGNPGKNQASFRYTSGKRNDLNEGEILLESKNMSIGG